MMRESSFSVIREEFALVGYEEEDSRKDAKEEIRRAGTLSAKTGRKSSLVDRVQPHTLT